MVCVGQELGWERVWGADPCGCCAGAGAAVCHMRTLLIGPHFSILRALHPLQAGQCQTQAAPAPLLPQVPRDVLAFQGSEWKEGLVFPS